MERDMSPVKHVSIYVNQFYFTSCNNNNHLCDEISDVPKVLWYSVPRAKEIVYWVMESTCEDINVCGSAFSGL